MSEADDMGMNRALTYRSGVAARLAGLSVETLRVWERRYALSDTQRSERGQRLYSSEQVRRLGLLKQLVDQGHPIGVLTGLPVERLRELLGADDGAQHAPRGPMRVLLVGESLARRVASGGAQALAFQVVGRCTRLPQVQGVRVERAEVPVDVLVIELSEPDDAAVAQVVDARAQVNAGAVLVLYRFCSSATIRALREHGCLVARVPAELGELVLLCRAALAGQGLPSHPALQDAVTVPRIDDATLARLATVKNALACECPRHLADLLLMVGSFERYSAQCAARNRDDALLHRELEQAAAHARTILEAAMHRLAAAEGLEI